MRKRRFPKEVPVSAIGAIRGQIGRSTVKDNMPGVFIISWEEENGFEGEGAV